MFGYRPNNEWLLPVTWSTITAFVRTSKQGWGEGATWIMLSLCQISLIKDLIFFLDFFNDYLFTILTCSRIFIRISFPTKWYVKPRLKSSAFLFWSTVFLDIIKKNIISVKVIWLMDFAKTFDVHTWNDSASYP